MNPDRRVMLGMLSAGGFGACTGTALAASDGPDLTQASRDLLFTDVPTARAALKAIVASGRQDMLAVIILARRYVGRGPGLRDDLIRAYRTLSGDDASSWFDMMLWQEKHPGIVPHPSFRQIKLDALARIDPAFLRFLEGERSDPARMRIRLEEIAWGGVRVDGIPSLDDPLLIPAGAADYLLETDLVFGVEINGDARAYPLRIMGWHEMFNDVIGGVPVALAYCTLCGAGILYETALPGFDTPLRFGSSGFLYRSNKLMFDRQTDSLWNQFTGEPVVGPLVGRGLKLRERPVTVTDWRTWRQAHPGGRVLSLQTGHARDYGSGVVYRDYFASEALMFPSAGGGGGLEQKDRIFGLRLPGGAKAYPLHAFRGGRVLNDSVGFTDVVLIGDEATRTVRAYESGGRVFNTSDAETVTGPGGKWRIGEEFLTGPDGTRLPRLPGHIAYWFGWQSFLGGNSAYWEG